MAQLFLSTNHCLHVTNSEGCGQKIQATVSDFRQVWSITFQPRPFLSGTPTLSYHSETAAGNVTASKAEAGASSRSSSPSEDNQKRRQKKKYKYLNWVKSPKRRSDPGRRVTALRRTPEEIAAEGEAIAKLPFPEEQKGEVDYSDDDVEPEGWGSMAVSRCRVGRTFSASRELT